MSDHKSEYRSIFKATSIFGGVQVFNIIISLIRGKVLAVLIGTAGMGLNGLLMSSLTLITKLTGLGLNESAIREISASYQSNDINQIQRIYSIFKRWIWITATIGLILTITLSPLLSQIAFGDKSYTLDFILLSVTFIFGALTGGIYTLLRGMRRIRNLAGANILGSIAGLLVSIPIIYFYGLKGVVLAIISTSAASYLISLYFRRKVSIKTTVLSLRDTWLGGKQMVSLGIILTASSLLTSVVEFILNAYISKTSSLNDLGIYNAGNSIMSGYVGMVFIAMATDYYPRLSGVINKSGYWEKVVNQQAETVLLILGPLLLFVLFSAPFLIRILLSGEFIRAIDFIIWASLAIMLKAIAWVSGYIIISKGDNKIFLFTEIAGKSWSLPLNILFYNLLGVKGLGISMIVSFSLASIMMYLVVKIRYKFILSRSTYNYFGIFSVLLASTVLFISFFGYPHAYKFAGVAFLISLVISLKGLNNRLDIMEVINKFKNSKAKKN